MVHLSHVLVDQGEGILADIANVTDDLRDGWEHKAHQVENRTLLKYLFKAAKKGHRVCILSGDVHVAAAFRLTDPDSGKVIYQLTSSAITYNQSRALGWALGKVVPDTGVTHDGYQFKRLARYTDSNFSLISVDPDKDMVDFQLYGEQVTHDPDNGDARQNSHSIAKIELRFTE
jgi:alkaline phosphatase D